MLILAVDPGTTKSAVALLDTKRRLKGKAYLANEKVLALVRRSNAAHLVVEQIKSYGNVMGDDVLTTVLWSGRFIEAWGKDFTLLPRKAIVTRLCGNARAKDKNVRQAIIDFYPRTGGGTNPSIGTKRLPGPLYGVVGDMWSAVAVGLVWLEIRDESKGTFVKTPEKRLGATSRP